jgi:GNAT superfamily N-acetyltransferase
MSDSSNDRSTKPSLVIRAMTLEDAQTVAELSGQLGYEVSVKEIAKRILQSLNAEQQIAFVACLGTEIVGWIEASLMSELQSPPYTLISGLVVREERRSLGIGKLLCAEVEAWSRKHSVLLLRVTSRISRESAHRFYLREGFQRIKTWAVFEKMLS